MNYKNLLTILLLSFFAVSCTSIPMANVAQDSAAKQFEKTSGKANLYIYRKGLYGAAVDIPVLINDRQVGSLATSNFQKFSLPAGSYELTTSGFNTYKKSSRNLRNNTNTYIEARLLPGLLKNKVEFKQQSPEIAKSYITKSRLTAHIQDPLSLPTEAHKREQQQILAEQRASQRQQSGQGNSDATGKTIASLAALGAGAFIADSGDMAGAGNFVTSALGGILGGRTPQASDFNKGNSTTSNNRSQLGSPVRSTNKRNLIDVKKLRTKSDSGQQYKKYADFMFKKYKETGDEKYYLMHQQTVESFEAMIKK